MTWQHLACGANGIMYYAFCSLRDKFKGAEFDERWTELKEIAAEVKKYEKVFLTDEDAPSVRSDNDLVPVRVWKFAGETWLLAVNATRESQKATVSVASALGERMQAEFGPVPVRQDGKFEYELKPLACSLVKLEVR